MKVMTNLDLLRNQLINGVIQQVDTDPTTKLKAGWIIFNTDEAKLKYYNGEEWVSIGAGGGGTVDIATTITETSTNSKAAGAKAVYDFVTDQLSDIRAVTNGLVLMTDETTGEVIGITVDTTVTEDSDNLITSGAVYTAISDAVSTMDAMKFKGTIAADGTITSTDTDINGSVITALTTFKNGWTFKATGTIPTSVTNLDKSVEPGDMVIICADMNAYDETKINVVQTNLDGVVIGPASATDESIAVYDGATGKAIKASIITKTQLENLFTEMIDLEAQADAPDVYLTSSNNDDVTIVKPGQTVSARLKATGVNADEYGSNAGIVSGEIDDGDSFTIPKFTVDGKGRLTAASNQTITLNLSSKGNINRRTNPAITATANADGVWLIDDIALDALPSVNIYVTATGEMVLTDVTVDVANDEITITFRNTTDISAGTYTAVIVS